MKHTTLLLVLFTGLFTGALLAQEVDLDTRFGGDNTSPLAQARRVYEGRIAQAQEQYNARVKLLHEQYVKQLRGMAATSKRSGNAEESAAIEAELQELETEGPLLINVADIQATVVVDKKKIGNGYGLWKVMIDKDTYRVYRFFADGRIHFIESRSPKGNAWINAADGRQTGRNLKLRRMGDAIVFDMDGFTEAFRPGKDGTLSWARWRTADFPDGKPVDEGVATFHGEAIE